VALATRSFNNLSFSLQILATGIIGRRTVLAMAFDRNPRFGADHSFSEGARRVADFLWENTGGDLTAFPRSYLENLRHDFADGKVSMMELIDRVDLGPDATYDDYCEVVDSLLSVDPNHWPDPDTVVQVPAGRLAYEIEPEVDFSEFDFADEVIEEAAVAEGPEGTVVEEGAAVEAQVDPLSEKMELFFKKVISSVYLDGVTDVTDSQGNPPSESNNYLMSDDGKKFSGIFYDSAAGEKPKQFPFVISEGMTGKWNISY